MQEQEIIEGNKLIAEFMEYQILHKKYQYMNCNSSNESYFELDEGDIVCDKYGYEVNLYPNGDPLFDLSNIPFNTSWKWLMKAVEKIESIQDEYQGRFGVHIVSNTCTIQSTKFRPDKKIPDPPHYFDDVILDSKIESTWYAVVRFIKWYNAQKK